METKKLATDIMNYNTTLWMDNHMLIMPDMTIHEDSIKKDKFTNLSTSVNPPIILQPLYASSKHDETFAQDVDICNKPESVSCTWCKNEFPDKNALLEHIKQNHRVDRIYRCFECSKVFTQKSNLKAHYRLHTGEKPFNCCYCTKTFAQKSNLVNHLSVHTRDKPFVCPVCKRAFSQRSNLKSHIFTHTGEKPYACNFCGKDFIQKSNLVSHIRIHTAEKPHQCNICDKCFSQRSNLICHIKLHVKVNS